MAQTLGRLEAFDQLTQRREQAVQLRHQHAAGGDIDQLVAAAPPEAELQFTGIGHAYADTRATAITAFIFAQRLNLGQRHAIACRMFAQHLHLMGALGIQRHMLQVTAATAAEIGTGRRHATVSRVVTCTHMRLIEALVGAVDGQRHALAGQGLIDELGLAALVMGDAAPVMGQAVDRQPLAVGVAGIAGATTGHFLLATGRLARRSLLSEQRHQERSPATASLWGVSC